ncbi:MAG: hypothetical protein Q7S36_00675 [Candidatus Liptonbacteria bacterium]|nr:hypothetical protein [Candidatus Liptonbacteria bacterium]
MMENNKKLYHIMFLPIVGDLDHDFVFNAIIMVIFFGLYIWYSRREHKHTDELLSEVKKIREKIDKYFGDEDSGPHGGKSHSHGGEMHVH